MSDDPTPPIPSPLAPGPTVQAQLLITMELNSGQIHVQGPIGNLPLCYSMLECAKDAIRDHVKQNKDKRVQLVDGMAVPPHFGKFKS